MNSKLKIGLIFIGALIIVKAAFLVVKPRSEMVVATGDLDSYLESIVRANNPPGVSLAVIKDGSILYENSAGLADGIKGSPATNDTVYHWWSMTKVVTAIGILQLSEKGLVDLDAPVSDYLNYFEVEYGKFTGLITLRQLLRHSSGLPDNVPDIIGWVHNEDVVYNQVDQLKRYMTKYNKLRYEPDSKFAYTNFGYMVLGAVIAEVSGRSYEDYVTENILRPSNMNETGFLYSADLGENEAAGSHPLLNYMTPLLPFYLDLNEIISGRTGSTLWFNRIYLDVTPSSGLIGPIDDAARLLIAINTPGVLLSMESLEGMLPTGMDTPERPLGWAEFNLDGRLWVQHSGGGPGFASVMRYYPEEDLGIVVMANGTNLDRGIVADTVASLKW